MAARGRTGGGQPAGAAARAGARRAPPRRVVDEQLARLSALRAALATAAPGEADLAVLREAIDSPSSFVVARTAAIVREAGLLALLPSLARTFDRFLEDGAERDPGCAAKLAIVEALLAAEAAEPAPLLAGVRHRQPEAAWGPPVDTAASLRASCAVGLANLRHPEALDELSRLLADPEPTARAGAARALGATGSEAALPLLRYKLLLGDASAEVVGECCAALLTLAPAPALALLAERLGGDDAPTAEAAALALGQSRLPEALPILVAHAEAQLGAGKRVPLMAIGLLRTREATDHLIEQVAEAAPPVAAYAVAALAIQRFDDGVRARVDRAVADREVPALTAAFEASFQRA